jgi:hypothetical protein
MKCGRLYNTCTPTSVNEVGFRLKSLGQSKIPRGYALVPDHKSGLKTLGSSWATGPKWHHDMRLEPLGCAQGCQVVHLES